jgi:hypothetical protein
MKIVRSFTFLARSFCFARQLVDSYVSRMTDRACAKKSECHISVVLGWLAFHAKP